VEETCKYYKYVPHHQQKVWEDAGWVFERDLGPPHAAYASLFKWPLESAPVIPDGTGVVIIKTLPEIDDGEQ
jgi:hypothetical protein